MATERIVNSAELALELADLGLRVLLLLLQQLLRLVLAALKVAFAKPVPDGLVIVSEDNLVGRVVEQVVKLLFLLDLLLDVVLPVVKPPKSVDRLLIVRAHLDVILGRVAFHARPIGVGL